MNFKQATESLTAVDIYTLLRNIIIFFLHLLRFCANGVWHIGSYFYLCVKSIDLGIHVSRRCQSSRPSKWFCRCFRCRCCCEWHTQQANRSGQQSTFQPYSNVPFEWRNCVSVRAFVLHFIYDLVWVTFDLYTIHICKYVYFPIVQWIDLAWLKIALRKCHILTFSLIYPLVTLTRWLWTRRSVKHIPTNSTISIGSKQFPHG